MGVGDIFECDSTISVEAIKIAFDGDEHPAVSLLILRLSAAHPSRLLPKLVRFSSCVVIGLAQVQTS